MCASVGGREADETESQSERDRWADRQTEKMNYRKSRVESYTLFEYVYDNNINGEIECHHLTIMHY